MATGKSSPPARTTARKLTVAVVSHTHWDREWYLPFQEFRWKLVTLIDELLGELGRPSSHSGSNITEFPHPSPVLDGEGIERSLSLGAEPFRCFMLDGQTILLEDYLELRPHRREELRRNIAAGRILVGPWYVLPDEFLVSGEALIRNLLVGDRVAREFGRPMEVGYLPDQFGHVSQMPQLLKGFGFNSAVVWRGIGDELARSEFNWRSPDGSQIFTLHLPTGYFNGQLLPNDSHQLAKRAKSIGKALAGRTGSNYVLIMNGGDHQFVHRGLPALIAAANEELAALGDVEIAHYCLPELLEDIKRSLAANGADVPVIEGELRNCQRAHLLPGVLSSRIWIKQRNTACENLLERWAEPMNAWATLESPTTVDSSIREYGEFDRAGAEASLRLAWKYLLQNHPHDSICGCSSDQVHEEMIARFNWSEGLAEGVARQGMERLAAHVDTLGLAQDRDSSTKHHERFAVVFNPVGGPRTDFVTMTLKGTVADRFAAFDEDGRAFPVQILLKRTNPVNGLPEVDLGFVACDVPGHGYRAFRLAVGGAEAKCETSISGRRMENEHFIVEVGGQNGTLRVFDKSTARWYEGLNRFVDGGDAGDEYNYDAPPCDMLVDNSAEAPSIVPVENGPGKYTLRVKTSLMVPRALAADRQSRSLDKIPLPVTSFITLYSGVARVDIRTEVDNWARDHRLRVLFPTGIDSGHSNAESIFAVEQHPIEPPSYTDDWVEIPVVTFPQKSFADVNDGINGIMVANRGLPEYEALRSERGLTIALTLLRCTGWLSRDDLRSRRGPAGPVIPAPGGQCLGKHYFEYSLIPHRGDWPAGFAQARAFASPLRAAVAGSHTGDLPAHLSFVEVQPSELVVSAVKLAEHGEAIILRLYNPTRNPVQGKVAMHRSFATVSLSSLREEPRDLLARDASVVRIDVSPSQVVTLRFNLR